MLPARDDTSRRTGTRRHRLLLPLLAVALLLATACTSGDDSDAAATPDPTTAAPDSSAAPSPVATVTDVSTETETVTDPATDAAAEGVTVLDEVPEPLASVDMGATAAASVAWRDSAGDHLVVLRDYTPGDARPVDSTASLTAVHYVPSPSGDGSLQAVAEIGEPFEDCGDADLVDRMYPDTLSVEDVDGNGTGEAFFVFATGCATDIAGTVTAAAFEGDRVATVTGVRPTVGGTGQGEPDAIDAGPQEAVEVREALQDLWNSELTIEES